MELTRPSTATASPLRLRVHYESARVGSVMSKVYMIRVTAAVLLVGGIFAYMIHYTEVATLSNIFGWLAFSIATGAIAFFAVFAPYGMRSHTIVFGRRQRYRRPVPEIPGRVAGLILIAVIACCSLSFGFYVYGGR